LLFSISGYTFAESAAAANFAAGMTASAKTAAVNVHKKEKGSRDGQHSQGSEVPSDFVFVTCASVQIGRENFFAITAGFCRIETSRT